MNDISKLDIDEKITPDKEKELDKLDVKKNEMISPESEDSKEINDTQDEKENNGAKAPFHISKTAIIIISVVLFVAVAGILIYKFTSKDEAKVTLGKYKGLSYKTVQVSIRDEDVDKEIQSIVDSKTVFKKLDDRAGSKTKTGDIVNCSYKANYDGKLVQEGAGNFTIGQGDFVEFENAITDKIVGDTIQVVAEIPTDYKGIKELEAVAGKEINFDVTLNFVSEKKIPEVNDEFVKEVSNGKCTNASEFKSYIKNKLESEKKEAEEEKIIEQLINQVIENSKFEKIDGMVKEYYDTMYATYESGAKHYELSMEDYINQFYSMNMDEFKKKLNDTMVDLVKEQLVLKEIIKVEKLKISKEKYDEYLEEYLKQYEYTDKDKFIEEYGKDSIEESMLYDYAIEFLIEHATAEVAIID